VVDLADFPDVGYKRSAKDNDFVDIMQELHEQVKHKLHERNNKYKHGTNLQ
jgi:hypothetical protein